MRNYLTEQVFNLVYLINEYQKHWKTHILYNKSRNHLKWLHSKVAAWYHAISSTHNERLTRLQSILVFFRRLGSSLQKKEDLVVKTPIFITMEFYMDTVSCIKGFIARCHQRCEDHPITFCLWEYILPGSIYIQWKTKHESRRNPI